MISYLCLSYYHHGENFEKAGNDINISNDKMTITKVSTTYTWHNTAYGKTWIDSSINQIAEWKFKIDKLAGQIYICLVSKDNRLNRDCNSSEDSPNFGVNNEGIMVKHGGTPKRLNGLRFYQNDEISMILNTKNRELSVEYADGQRLGLWEIPIGNNIRYKMAVSLFFGQDRISLIDFSDNTI